MCYLADSLRDLHENLLLVYIVSGQYVRTVD